MVYLEVKPAYGRTYPNQRRVREDWADCLDFRLTDTGQYVNREQLQNGEHVIVRYGQRLEKVMQVQ